MANCGFTADGLIGERWRLMGGELGPFGCPTGAETDLGDGLPGRRQAFEGGEIAWMAAQEMVLSVFRYGNDACFEWALVPTSLLHYDYFRFDVWHRPDASTAFSGGGQRNMQVFHSKLGRRWVTLQDFGEYAFTVAGYDSSDETPQGWTATVRLTVGPKPGDPGPIPVTGVIAERWHMFDAWDGPLGRPVQAESGHADYRMQVFERGVIAALPEFGPRMTVVAYQYGRSVEVHWGYITDEALAELSHRTMPFPGLEGHVKDTAYTLFEAIDPDGAPHVELITSTMAHWYGWAHHGATSGCTRFFPHRGSLAWNAGDTPSPQLIRITNFTGRAFSVPISFVHRAMDAPMTIRPPDGSPEQAYAYHDERLDQIAEHLVRTRPLVRRYEETGEDITFKLMALLHLAAKDPGHRSPGQPRSAAQVAVVLRELRWGPMGTDMDYDMCLKGLMTVVCRHPKLFTEQQIQFVLDELAPFTMYGAHDPDVERVRFEFVVGFYGPETENHILMIETCRYLVSQLRFARTGDPAYNSLDKGLTDWLLGYLHTIAKHDFLEFNSRSYHRLAIHALLNLYEFSTDHTVKVAARNLLDYAAVKFAVSSSGSRHLGPFRRRKESFYRADESSPFNYLYSNVGNPMTGFFLAYLGFVEPSGEPGGFFPDGWGPEALIAGLSSYRPPDAAYVLAGTTQPPMQHTFYHGRRPRPTASVDDPDGGLEIYYKSPSFLLTAGGMFLNSGTGHDELVQTFTGTNGVALAQAITLLPARREVTFAALIRFDGWKHERAVNTGVHLGFACGANLRIPGTPDDQNGWIFLDHSELGYYVAAYRTQPAHTEELKVFGAPIDNLGCFYVMELREARDGRAVEPEVRPISFETFKRLTVERNQLPERLSYMAAYLCHTADGHSFTFSPLIFGAKYKPRILYMDGQPLPEDFTARPLADGPYINAKHDGIVKITQPGCDIPLVLDFHNPVHATRTNNTAACPKWRLDAVRSLGDRARALHAEGRHPESLEATRKVVAHFGHGLPDTYLQEFAEMWMTTASTAHPHKITDQLAAARNGWEAFRHLAGLPDLPEERRAILAGRINTLAGLLAFGSPTSGQAGAAAALARDLYAGLTGEHRLDIAASWSGEAQFHHEISFHPDCPDPSAEQLRQRQSAAEAAAIVFPIAAALPDAAFALPDLQRVAGILHHLIVPLTFGGPESAPSVRAAELAQHVYTQMTDGDHRLDLAAIWTSLSQRHHEISFHPDCPHPSAEQLSQRRAAKKAADLLFPLVDPLPASPLTRIDLNRAANLLDRLTGLLTFGATANDLETGHLQALATRAAALRDEIRSLSPLK